jgi:hypothetical protein
MSELDRKVPTFHSPVRPLDNPPGCPPNIGIPIDVSPLSDPQIFTDLVHLSIPGAGWFQWGGYWKQAGVGQPYHSYTTDLFVPTGAVAVILQAGFESATDAVYDMYLDGAPHPLLSAMGNYTSTYDEINPPGATTFTGRATAMATRTDGAVSGICYGLTFQPNPLVIDEGVNVRVRQRVHVVNKTTYGGIWGYYAPKPTGVRIV